MCGDYPAHVHAVTEPTANTMMQQCKTNTAGAIENGGDHFFGIYRRGRSPAQRMKFVTTQMSRTNPNICMHTIR